MLIMVRHIGTSFFYQRGNRWTLRWQDAFLFKNLDEAEEFCRQKNSALLRVVQRWDGSSSLTIHSPTGKQLARSMTENVRLRKEKETLAAEIDSLIAEGKERRKKYPFKPKSGK